MARARTALAVLVLFAAAAALAGPSADAVVAGLQAALGAWKKKDAALTVKEIERALAAARTAAPLEIRQAVVVHAPHTGLGLYTPAPGDAVLGRDMRLYVEVANFTAQAAEGGATVLLEVAAEFTFLDGEEPVPLGTTPLGTQQFFTRTHSGVTSFGVDVRLGDKSPPGVYRAALSVTDKHSGKSAQRDVRFVLR